jgi:predicted metal-dependent hydrolase
MATHKSPKIEAMIEPFHGRRFDPHYYGYFDCFNRQLYYEAHDVLEDLWLPQRKGPEGNFFKGLIQLAGAFVHLQKNRLKPAGALFLLAAGNLTPYAPVHLGLDIDAVLHLIADWRKQLELSQYTTNPLSPFSLPQLTVPDN